MVHGHLNDGVTRFHTLDNHLPFGCSPTSTATDLFNELECTFVGSEIRYDSKLSADMIPTSPTLSKSNPLVTICVPTRISTSPCSTLRMRSPKACFPCSIKIHSLHGCFWKECRSFLSNLFSTESFVKHALAAARRTLHHRRRLVPTIMAFELVRTFVVGQRDITSGTPFHMTTGLTLLEGAEPFYFGTR